MPSLTKPLNAIGLFALFAALFCCPAGLLAADEYTGQFVPELEPERGNLDKVVFQPATGRLNFKLPALDAG
jgi:hypothetical protein